MPTYKVKLVSQTNAIVFLFGVFSFIIAEVLLFFPHGLHNQALSIAITIPHLIVFFFLWQKLVTGRTEWVIDKNGVTITWTRKFAYSNVSDYFFKWNEIEKIWKGFDPNYYNLKFKFTSGKRKTFYHDVFTTKDDFREMLETLYQTFYDNKNIQPT